MKKRKIALTAVVLVTAAILLSETQTGIAYAVEGWESAGGEWRYLDDQDQPVTDVWKQSKEAWFYLDSAGQMVKDRFIDRGSGLYYVDADGRRVQGSWVWSDGKRQEGYEEGWYYFGSNGKAYRRAGGFKREIGGKTYVFDESGKMLTGWLNEEGRPLTEDENPLTEGVYYAGEDGALWSSTWLDYGSMELGAADELESSVTGRDYTEYKELWLYFDNNFKRIKSSGDRVKQKVINGATYGFDEYGIMLPWWSRVASVSDADRSNPTSSESAKYFAGYDGGRLLRNTWFWMCPSENLDEQDYSNGEYSWWYTDQDGEVYRNRIRKVNGRNYAFDGLGRMRTGFVLFDGKDTFVAQYDTDDWTSEDFKNGDLYGLEKADLYLFAPDELNDGSMQTGGDIKVELSDGVFTFGFGSSGIAYGNRNKIRKWKNAYYINGLKLEADKEYGYGVVWEDEDIYRVVDTRGNVVSGQKKVVRDRDGGWLIILNGRFAARTDDSSKPKWHNGEEGEGFYHYDGSDKDDKYSGGLIAGYDSEPVLDQLPAEERLNFE